MPKDALKSAWHKADSTRQQVLDRARLGSALTKPWVLPPESMAKNDALPEPFSSLAARGITNLEGRLLLALYPPGLPFFRLKPAAKYRLDPSVDPNILSQFEQHLFLRELAILAKLEQTDRPKTTNTRRAGFRSRKRTSISQLLITGDTLEMLTDDYQIKVFRRDQYCTGRDSSGGVQFHIIKEHIDPLSLSPKQLELLEINVDSTLEKSSQDRKEDMYTMVEWEPMSKRWCIKQEVKGVIIEESEEKVNPFMSTPFELAPGEDYGRGLIEVNLGDVRSMNSLTERILDFAATSSKQLFVLDYNSQVRASDLAKPSGSVIQARVAAGQVVDISTLKVDKMSDFSIVGQTREAIRRDLSAVMLMEGESTPRGDRVTAYQVQRVAMELEGALGGVYAPIADSMQIGLIERIMYQMKRDKAMQPLPDDSVEIEAVTGIAALSRESDQGKLVGVLQTIAQLGPETLARIDKGILLDLMMRQAGVYQAGLIKTNEQINAEMQAAQEAQTKAQAGQQLIQSAGKVAEQNMTPESIGAMANG